MSHHRIVIVGTGFSGLGMAIRLRREGEHDFVLLERAGEVGGTWRDNTYPGCRCDVPSHLYSFSFAPNPDWTRTFSPQPRDPATTCATCAEQLRRRCRTSASATSCSRRRLGRRRAALADRDRRRARSPPTC